MRNAFSQAIYNLVKNDNNVLALIGDAGHGVFDRIQEEHPAQFINFGIAEANMITAAAGLASSGFIPFVYAIGPHLTLRPYEQIRNDLCFNETNVKIVSIGGGLHYSNQGPTHQLIEDFAVLKILPNMTIFSPCSPMEVYWMTTEASKIKGPVYMRIGRATDTKLEYKLKIGEGVEMKKGDDATIIATGATVYDAYNAAYEFEKKGVSIRVLNLHTIKPLDEKIIIKAANETEIVLTVEEHRIEGGLGNSVARVILENCNKNIKFKRLGIKDVFCSYCGSYEKIKTNYGYSKEDIIEEMGRLIKKSLEEKT